MTQITIGVAKDLTKLGECMNRWLFRTDCPVYLPACLLTDKRALCCAAQAARP